MNKTMIAVLLASSVSLSACTTYGNDRTAGNLATGAAYGAAGGAALGAIVPGVSIVEGALAGAAIGGIANAVWADNNRDGYVDGYVQNGQYYSGTPQGYDPTLRRVATGAIDGAFLTGAVIGAAVGGLAGAVWADNNGDGQTDGYVYNGQYYPGAPQGYQGQAAPQPMPAPAPIYPAPSRGERG
ncbi:hypothetical protein [Sphingomonas sp.]|uniref:hypothetical protein n=1 Tax=Sphingomonas sp. TaxID=28214 RepID=UPI0037513B3D